ncbi:hypothetical protein QM012_003064 [Aureobasidium pullulans]|uniref:Transcription factor domain-containing protein n=1 Tax=Aureobasidium pullulans TaxID=5580 RepID=A0ABR0TAK4_AURPU
MFINITTPSDTQKGPLRRAIRSQAALSSATCRKNTIAAKASSNSNSPEDQTTPRVRRRSKVKAIKDIAEAPSSSSVSVSSRRNSSSPTSLSPVQQYQLVSPQLGQQIIQFDSSSTFPYADAWHSKIPQLVDTYLTYFAPSVQDPIYVSDRHILRQELWPETISHRALFFTSLLLASSHPSFSRERTQEITAWFRLEAMRSLQLGLNSTTGLNTSDQMIATVCLLCAWEFQFGDEVSAKAHMTGLKTMVNLRGGFHEASLPPIVRRLVSFVTYDQPWYSGMEPVFVPQGLNQPFTGNLSSLDLPAGFASLAQSHRISPIAPSTLGLISEVNLIMKRPRHRKFALLDVQARLVEYNFLANVTSNFSPIQTSMDDTISVQAEMHIKLALLSLISHLQGSSSEQYWEMSESLFPEVLINTVYAEVGLWALFLTCSTMQIPPPRLLDGLEKLVSSLLLVDWSLVDLTLRQYLYPLDSLDVASQALWNRMTLNRETIFEQNNLSRFHVAVYTRNEEPIV